MMGIAAAYECCSRIMERLYVVRDFCVRENGIWPAAWFGELAQLAADARALLADSGVQRVLDLVYAVEVAPFGVRHKTYCVAVVHLANQLAEAAERTELDVVPAVVLHLSPGTGEPSLPLDCVVRILGTEEAVLLDKLPSYSIWKMNGRAYIPVFSVALKTSDTLLAVEQFGRVTWQLIRTELEVVDVALRKERSRARMEEVGYSDAECDE